MNINSINYINMGKIDNIDEIRDLAIKEDFSRKTIRDTSYQQDTNIVVGLHSMVESVGSFYEEDVMLKYDKFIPDILRVIQEYHGYKFIQMSSFNLVKLKPGGEILPHIDNNDVSYSYHNRLHIPLVTNKDVTFTVGGEEKYLEYGDLVEINNMREHSVVNNSDEDRIHLILDVYGISGYYDKELPPVPKEFYKEN